MYGCGYMHVHTSRLGSSGNDPGNNLSCLHAYNMFGLLYAQLKQAYSAAKETTTESKMPPLSEP